MLGFVSEGRENTEGNQWANAEKKYLAEVMERYGITRSEDKEEKRENLSVLDYKKQEHSREVEELTEQAEALEQSNAEAQRETAEIRESLEKMKSELSELTEDNIPQQTLHSADLKAEGGHPQAHRQRSGDFKAMEENRCGKG